MPIPTQNCIQQKKSWPQYHNCFLSELHRDSPANSTAAAASYWRYGLLLPGSSLLAASTASSSKTSWFGAPGVDKKQVMWVKPTVGNQRNKGSLEGLEPRAAKVYLWDTHTAAACGDVCGLWYHILWSSHMLPVSGQPGSRHPAVPCPDLRDQNLAVLLQFFFLRSCLHAMVWGLLDFEFQLPHYQIRAFFCSVSAWRVNRRKLALIWAEKVLFRG